MTRTIAGLVSFCLFAVAIHTSAIAGGSEPTSSVDSCEIGTLNLTSQPLDLARLRSQTAGRCQLIAEADVRRRFAGHAPDESATAAPDALTERLKAGIHDFYYQDPATALDTLDGMFDAVQDRASRAALEPHLARTAWDAGVVTIRALQRTGADSQAQHRAARLVALFPTRRPEPRKVTPAARRLIHRERARLADDDATLELQILGGDSKCVAQLNGIDAPTGESIPVSPDLSYATRASCGSQTGPARLLSTESAPQDERTTLLAPLPDTDTATQLHRTDRDAWFRYLEAVADQMTIDRLVVLHQQADAHTRIIGAGSAPPATTTTTHLQTTDFRQILGPAFSAATMRSAPAGAVDSRSHVGDWALVSGGAALGIGAGVYTAAVLLPRGRELACSPNNSDPISGSRCHGVTRLEFDDRAAFDAAVADFRLARGLTIGAAAVGVGLTSWALWRLVNRDRQIRRPSPSRIRLHVNAGPDRAGIQLTGGF